MIPRFDIYWYSILLCSTVVRGFLGRCIAQRRRLQAEQERVIMEGLLKQIGDCSVAVSALQESVLSEDKNIPTEFFSTTAATTKSSTIVSSQSYLQPVAVDKVSPSYRF